MNRNDATKLTRELLNQYNLSDWGVRISTDTSKNWFLGLCSYKDKCIIINGHHIDQHPEPEIENTIRHEIAHALTPGHNHDEIWAAKAKEVGCTSVAPCSHLSLSPAIIDAIRSGADVEVSFETEVIHKPKYTVSRLQDKCPFCGKVAKEKFSFVATDKDGNECKMITLECFHVIKKIIPRATPFDTIVSNSHLPHVSSCKHEFDKNQCRKCGEYKPFDYQVGGMRFLEVALSTNKGGAIFDEMGLGKTVQALGYLKFHRESAPILFIVKSGIMFQWFKEIIRWLGPEYIAQIIKTSRDTVLPGLKAYIISYDLLRRFDKDELSHIKTVVLDECQMIKNPDSTRTQEVRRIVKNAEHVIPLSGTPWKNRGSEFFTVLNMLNPSKFYSYDHFVNRWVDFYFHGNKMKEGGIRNPQQFKEFIRDMAIRRERTEVMKELPLISRVMQFTEIDKTSQKEYDDTVSDFVKWYNEQVVGGDDEGMEYQQNLLAQLAKMRHITGLAKIPATVEFVKEFIEESEQKKIVVFVHHKDVGHILFKTLSDELRESGVPVLKLTAEHSAQERFVIQEEFNKLDKVVMVGSTLASGEGLNLQTCAACVMHERQWNPANEEQAEGRFIRIGQTAVNVTATYMTAAGTVDEHLSGIVERKRVDFHNAMNKGEMPIWKQTDIMKELTDAIVKDWSKRNAR